MTVVAMENFKDAERKTRSRPAPPDERCSSEIRAPLRQGGVEFIHYQPAKTDPERLPLVLMHGISRNAPALIAGFRPLAEELGISLLAPIFPGTGHKNYQRPATRSGHSDTALLDLLADLGGVGGDFGRVDMFGFSGGAQFAHRFALLQPGRCRRLLLASSGWYTFPHLQERYPYGIGRKGAPDPRFDLAGFLELSIKVVVGELDITRDPGLRSKGNVDEVQGLNRLERGANWTQAIAALMAERGAAGEAQFQVLPDCGHSFDDCVTVGGLRKTAMSWFGADT